MLNFLKPKIKTQPLITHALSILSGHLGVIRHGREDAISHEETVRASGRVIVGLDLQLSPIDVVVKYTTVDQGGRNKEVKQFRATRIKSDPGPLSRVLWNLYKGRYVNSCVALYRRDELVPISDEQGMRALRLALVYDHHKIILDGVTLSVDGDPKFEILPE